jgi:hypothetical protein
MRRSMRSGIDPCGGIVCKGTSGKAFPKRLLSNVPFPDKCSTPSFHMPVHLPNRHADLGGTVARSMAVLTSRAPSQHMTSRPPSLSDINDYDTDKFANPLKSHSRTYTLRQQ